MIPDWPALKALALSLNLPEVSVDYPWGNECLKAHGKMWCWWSPYVDAAVFKCAHDEREMLLAADPETFTLHPHYAPHNLILVRAGRIDEGWARAPDPTVARRRPEALAESLGHGEPTGLTQAPSLVHKYPGVLGQRPISLGLALFRARSRDKHCGDQPLILSTERP